MTHARATLLLVTAGLCACALPLRAEEPLPLVMGVQARASVPLGSLAKATGGSGIPGLGLSIFAESEYESGWKARVGVGGDLWTKGDWEDRPGVQGQASVLHLDVEAVKMLGPDGDTQSGPYIVGGLSGCAWSLKESGASGETVRTARLGATFGFGYRLNRHLEAEVRGFGSRVTSSFFASAIQVGLTWRF